VNGGEAIDAITRPMATAGLLGGGGAGALAGQSGTAGGDGYVDLIFFPLASP
jgi:hypothetical protein